MAINLEMDVPEAVYVHEAMTAQAAQAYKTWRYLVETNAPADEQAIAYAAVGIKNRVLARLSNALYPRCEWSADCEGVRVDGSIYCRTHRTISEAQRLYSVPA